MKDSTATPSMNLFFNMMTAQFYEFLWKWWRFVLMKHCAYTLLNRHSVRQWQPYVTWHCFNKCGLVHFIRIWHNNNGTILDSLLLWAFALQKVTDSSWPCSFNNVCLIWLGGATLLVLFLPSWTLVWNLLFLTYQLHVIVYIIWIEYHDHVFKAINSKVE